MTTMGEPKKRRQKGTGSIFATKEGGFRATIKLKDKAGNPVSHTKRFPTSWEAEKWLDGLVARSRGGALNRPSGHTVSTVRDLLRIWIIHKHNESETSGKPTESVIRDYDSQIRLHIIPILGSIELSRLHKDNIYEWLSYLNTVVSDITGKPLSNDRKHRVWGVLKQAFIWAVNEDYLQKNPLGGIKGPTLRHHDLIARSMTEEDYRRFLDFIQEKGCKHGEGYCELRWLLGIKGARRQGEVLGLDWNSCHLAEDPPYIQVDGRLKAKKWFHGCGDPVMPAGATKPLFPCGQKTATKCPTAEKGGLVIIEGTKGGQSNRPRLPVSSFMDAFKVHWEKQHQELEAAKANGTYSLLDSSHANLVFTQLNGRPYTARHDYKIFKRILTEAGISRPYRIHDLRHTSVTRLVQSSGLRTAQEIAGHRSVLMTSAYSKPSIENSDEAFRQLAEMDKRNAEALERKKKRQSGMNW